MPSNHSARLDLPYLAAGQLQKHVTLNQALTRLDALAQTAVVSRSIATQPADPDDGELYILPADATGVVWAAWNEGDLARAELGGWTRVPTPRGTLAVVLDEGSLVVRGCLRSGRVPARTRSPSSVARSSCWPGLPESGKTRRVRSDPGSSAASAPSEASPYAPSCKRHSGQPRSGCCGSDASEAAAAADCPAHGP